MATTKRKTLIDALFPRIENVLQRPEVPVDNKVVPQVADAVAREVAPVIQNATNQEPWFKSRIYWGLIAAGVGIATSKFGFVISGDDLMSIVDAGGEIFTAAGVLFALYGRIVGNRKKPLGG